MEGDSGAKIAIRGKGSVKEGKGRSDAAHASNQEEDLHCLIMADTEEKVNKAKKLIHNVIETVSQPSKLYQPFTDTSQAASIPEGQNELKRNQLRELAALNGTLRDDENQACQNCGKIGHRKYDCPEKQNFTASIICRVCGNAGHMARDCPDRQRGASWRNNDAGGRPAAGRIDSGDAVDREYEVRTPPIRLKYKILTDFSNSCKSLVEVLPDPLPASKPALAHRVTEMRSPGNEVRLVDLHLGAAATRILTKEGLRLPGPENAVVATRSNQLVAEAIATMVRRMVPVLQAQAPPLHGNNRLLEPRLVMPVILPMVPTVLLLEWALLLVLVLLAVHHHLLQVLLQVWVTLTLSSSSTLEQLLLHHLPVTLHLLLPVTSLRLLHLPVLR
jgi:hypothetical protein